MLLVGMQHPENLLFYFFYLLFPFYLFTMEFGLVWPALERRSSVDNTGEAKTEDWKDGVLGFVCFILLKFLFRNKSMFLLTFSLI